MSDETVVAQLLQQDLSKVGRFTDGNNPLFTQLNLLLKEIRKTQRMCNGVIQEFGGPVEDLKMRKIEKSIQQKREAERRKTAALKNKVVVPKDQKEN